MSQAGIAGDRLTVRKTVSDPRQRKGQAGRDQVRPGLSVFTEGPLTWPEVRCGAGRRVGLWPGYREADFRRLVGERPPTEDLLPKETVGPPAWSAAPS